MPAEDDSQEPRQDVDDEDILVDADRGGGGPSQSPLRKKIKSVVSEISIEPSLFLIMFGYGLYNVIAQVMTHYEVQVTLLVTQFTIF